MRYLSVIFVMIIAAGTIRAQHGWKWWNFDAQANGSTLADFTAWTGAWKVVPDPSAPSRPNVLVQRSSGPRQAAHLALVKNLILRNVELAVSIRGEEGGAGHEGGLVWRASSPDEYYLATYNPDDQRLRISCVTRGHATLILQSRHLRISGGWHVIKINMTDDHIRGYLDGEKYFDAQDKSIRAGGRIGLWTAGDSRAAFDDLMASGTP